MTAKLTAAEVATAHYPRRSPNFQQKKLRQVTLLLIISVGLVEKGIAQALGVRIPATRPPVGRQGRLPKRIGTLVAVHRKIEAVVEEQLRPFPPGAELLDPAQQVVAIDQGSGHVGGHRAEQETRLDDAVDLANGLDHLLFGDVAKARLEHEIELAIPERHVDDRSELVEPLQLVRCLGVNGAIVLDAPSIDPPLPQSAHEFAAG